MSRPWTSSMSWSYGNASPAATIWRMNDQIAGQSSAVASLINTGGSVPMAARAWNTSNPRWTKRPTQAR
jgi:hypothetical protein